MTLKKANAALGLLTIALLLIHVVYTLTCFILFVHNPKVNALIAHLCVAATAMHAVLGICIVVFAHDGSTLRRYPKENIRTIMQRASALGILVILGLHAKAFAIATGGGNGLQIAIILQTLFFTFVFMHIATSLSNAFVTLGWLDDMDKKKKIDRVVWVLCALIWIAAVIIVGSTFAKIASH